MRNLRNSRSIILCLRSTLPMEWSEYRDWCGNRKRVLLKLKKRILDFARWWIQTGESSGKRLLPVKKTLDVASRYVELKARLLPCIQKYFHLKFPVKPRLYFAWYDFMHWFFPDCFTASQFAGDAVRLKHHIRHRRSLKQSGFLIDNWKLKIENYFLHYQLSIINYHLLHLPNIAGH